MDLPKIPLWFLLIISTFSMSKCMSVGKYLVPNNIDGSNEDCFCFKKPGGYLKVPHLLNNNGNLERLVVYLYKDSTDQVKLYIPNAEKQRLVPDLPFEVDDKLNTLEDISQIKDVFNLYLRPAFSYHDMPIANEPHAEDMPEHADGNMVISTKNTIPYVISHEVSHSPKRYKKVFDNNSNYDSSLNNEILPEIVNIPAKIIDVDGFGYDQNYIEIDKILTNTIDIPNNGIYIDSANYMKPSGIFVIPPEVNTPSGSINDDSFANFPGNYIDIEKTPTEEVEVDISDKGIIIKDTNYNEPNSMMVKLPKQVNTPAESINIDGFDYYKKHNLPENNVDNIKTLSIEENIAIEGLNIDDGKHNKQNSISVQFEGVTIPAKGLNVDGFDYGEKHYWPDNSFDTNRLPSKEIDILAENININGFNYHGPKPFYVLPTNKINFPGKGTLYYNVNGGQNVLPHNSTNNIPQQSETQTNKNKWYAYIQPNEVEYLTDKTHNIAENQGFIKNYNTYETFNRWFIQQMQRFKSYTVHDRSIDLVMIEKHILKILHDNDMHVSDEGVLTDSFGRVLNVHNFHLRPILIGKSLAFGSILKEIPTDLVLPTHSAYLQAILVTQSSPTMILGIIPIGKTDIPPSTVKAFSSLVKPHYHNIHTLLHRPKHYHTHPIIRPIGHTKASPEFSMGYINGNKHIQLSAHVPVLGPKIRKSIFTLLKPNPVLKFQPLWDGNDAIKSAETPINLFASLRHDKGVLSSTPNYKNVEVEVNEDDIAERIIGGRAATSSGTPLSVKGRMKE